MDTAPRVLITGASTGIGEACARRLDAAGWQVFAGVRREEDAARLRAALSGRTTPVIVDVTDQSSIARAVAVIESTGEPGRGLDALVDNAGIAIAGPLECLPIAEFRRQLEVNVVGQLAVTQACLPLLRRRRGRIVLMGSIAGRLTLPFVGPYSASKRALEALADALRVELQPWDIPVVILEPGSIATPIWGKGAADAERIASGYDETARARYASAIARVQDAAAAAGRRGIHPDDVARVVERALTSRRPRPRYVVGRDARFQLILRALPDRLRDRVLTRAVGLPARGSKR